MTCLNHLFIDLKCLSDFVDGCLAASDETHRFAFEKIHGKIEHILDGFVHAEEQEETE